MGVFSIVFIFAATLAISFGLGLPERKFEIDYENDQFLMDGKPFRYVSGSFHYFRALPQTWKAKLRTMRAAGLNAVSTYVEWATHNPKENVYDFEGIADLAKFIQYAQEEDLYVILRPGPYICAERDNGGLPFWLFRKYPEIKPRTSDENYKREVALWYSKLLSVVRPYLYGNNGPIIMVQVENEYGSYHACDKAYTQWLGDETQKYVENKALLYTTDIPNDRFSCGKVEGAYATTDFGIDRDWEIDNIWRTVRSVEPKGPLVNSEFYPGWLTHWQEQNQRRNGDQVAATLRKMLNYNASVNFYMFFGGTNFGFTAGANGGGEGYVADITSYDYDAVMDEAGDPTDKFYKIRDVIKDFLEVPNIETSVAPKMSLPAVTLKPIDFILSEAGRKHLIVKNITKDVPATFEELDQFSGFVLYETQLPKINRDPVRLTVNKIRDRAIVLLDNIVLGVLSRETGVNSLPLSVGTGKTLQILVENQGRINYDITDDIKGILGDVTIEKNDNSPITLKHWISSSLPLDYSQVKQLVEDSKSKVVSVSQKGLLSAGPTVFYAEFQIDAATNIYDTYLDTTGWGKGVIYINGFNLGRYWPLVGPQITLYLPKDLLKAGANEIVVIEYQNAPNNSRVEFLAKAKLDGEGL